MKWIGSMTIGGLLMACVGFVGGGGVMLERAAVDQPEELGLVRWERNFFRAESVARSSGRPLMVLFQEVPG
ncbi:MAG: hypothetical protein KDC38_20980 [Planctomycetes bacterium]|nr:hypothetical protein [Planctomycetota bacterium]